MDRRVLVLEDDDDRVKRFQAALAQIDPSLQIICWSSATAMIREVEPHLTNAVLISLDHDLYVPSGETDDPGDGLDVARFLAPMQPTCPVIIHSSNADRCRRMQGELELEHWRVRMVAPLGADWVEVYWAQVVESLLVEGGYNDE